MIQIVRQRMLKANGCQKNSFNDVKRLQITVLIATIIRGHDGERCLIYCRCLFVGSSTAAAAAAASLSRLVAINANAVNDIILKNFLTTGIDSY